MSMLSKKCLGFFLLGSLLTSLNVKGENDSLFELTLEELMQIRVSSSSFFERPLSEAPGYVQVFDLNKLDLGAHYTLSDLLENYAVGSSIGSHGRHGALHGVRGVLVDNSAKTLLMVNGQHINPRSHFGASLSLNAPFLGDIQRVEVINGPGAILHGSGAINGFINLIPKTGGSHEGGFMTTTYGVKDQLSKVESGYGFSYGRNRNLYLYGGVIEADGFRSNSAHGINGEDANYKTYAWGRKSFRLSSNWNHDNFSLQAFYQQLDASSRNASAVGPIENKPFHTAYLGLQPKLNLEVTATESLEIIESLFWHEHLFPRTKESGGGRELHWENKLVFRTTRFDHHSLALGGLYGIKGFDGGRQFFQSDIQEAFESNDSGWQEYGVFLEDIWQVSDAFTVSFGLRYDEYAMDEVDVNGRIYDPEDGEQLSPRIALAYQINESHSLKSSYQHGFRMPDAAYFTWFTLNNSAAGRLGFPTATLEPEGMDSYEISYNWIALEDLNLGINVFYNEFKKQLAWGSLDNIWSAEQVTAINLETGAADWGWKGGQFQNSQVESQTYGGELIAKYRVFERTRVDLSYGYVELDGIDIQRFPSHQAKLNLTHRLLDNRLLLGVNYSVSSNYEEETTPGRDDIFDKSRHLVDCMARYKLSGKWSVRINIENVLGTDVPRMSFAPDRPYNGNLGADEQLIYMSLAYNVN